MTPPRRFIIGALLSAMAVGGALGFGLVGALDAPQTLTVRFTRGAALAPGEEARLTAFAVKAAAEPALSLRILGHTGDAGDAAANLALSEQRADVVRALILNAGVDAARLASVKGVGGADPLPKQADESDREHQRRLARAEIIASLSR